jgi:hypothetical protein
MPGMMLHRRYRAQPVFASVIAAQGSTAREETGRGSGRNRRGRPGCTWAHGNQAGMVTISGAAVDGDRNLSTLQRRT